MRPFKSLSNHKTLKIIAVLVGVGLAIGAVLVGIMMLAFSTPEQAHGYRKVEFVIEIILLVPFIVGFVVGLYQLVKRIFGLFGLR
jgi:hypothetical protein